MLRIGLTGGIGAGKSTIAARFRARGIPVIDADEIAREIVEPGEPALAALVTEFGEQILHPDGTLNRGGLAVIAFSDPESTARLNAIMHPAIVERTGEHFAACADAPITVHDVPLLVENAMTRLYHLAILVDTPAELRLERLVAGRGMDRADALKRIRAQASDEERIAACDVIIDNAGTPEQAQTAFDRILSDRIEPFAENLAAAQPAARPELQLIEVGPRQAEAAARLTARLRYALDEAGLEEVEVEHIGSTSVPGMLAKDVIDLQVLTDSAEQWDRVSSALTAAGFPVGCADAYDDWDEAGREPKRFHRNADPGQAAHVHVRTRLSRSARFSAHFAVELRSSAELRETYAQTKKRLAAQVSGDRAASRFAEAKEPFFTPLRRAFLAAETGEPKP